MNVEKFAEREYRDHIVYQELERLESVPEFKELLRDLVRHELADYEFWLSLSDQKRFHVPRWRIAAYVAMRRVLGLTFTVRFLERHERRMIEEYVKYADRAKPELKTRIMAAVDHAKQHERELISQIDEERVRFIGNIVLGVNDALISMSGALVGFSFAMNDSHEVGRAGLIMGTAASLSIAASAFMQARIGRPSDAAKAAAYSGLAFFVVVMALSSPFLLLEGILSSLGVMTMAIILLITMTSYYTAIVFQRRFLRQFRTMLLFGVGTAAITYVIGTQLPSA